MKTIYYVCIHFVELGDTDNVTSSSSKFKTGSVMITEEEQKLLAEEGIHLPVDMPLTKVHTYLYICKYIIINTCIIIG